MLAGRHDSTRWDTEPDGCAHTLCVVCHARDHADDGKTQAVNLDGLCEACNHDRIADDIGTVQIPKLVAKRLGDDVVDFEWSFGREYATKDLSTYDAIFHCGGCMLDQQRMRARLADLEAAGVPITNYGLLLSYFNHGDAALDRVLRPWETTQ
jgi:hypothetical protein